jgi:hypothetical protein
MEQTDPPSTVIPAKAGTQDSVRTADCLIISKIIKSCTLHLVSGFRRRDSKIFDLSKAR